MRKIFIVLEAILMVFSISLISYILLVLYQGSQTSELQLEEVKNFKVASTYTPTPNIIENQENVTDVIITESPKIHKDNFLIEIPKINLSVVVKNLTETEVIKANWGIPDNWGIPMEILDKWGVVRYPTLSYPGEGGLVAIAGHRDISGSPFLLLDRLEIGDTINIYLKGNDTPYTYLVTKTIEVKPEETWILDKQSDNEELRLTTCLVGSVKKRLIIFAERESS